MDPPKPEHLFFDLSDRFRLPAPTLSEIVYVSRRKPTFDDSAVVNMVVDAGIRNYLAGVSGRLWFSPRHFLQAIEGTSHTLDTFYAKIAADRRHTDVRLVRRRRLENRRFDRPMWLFRGDEEPTFREFVGQPAAGSFDEICEQTYARLVN